jgi:hypothetical protein
MLALLLLFGAGSPAPSLIDHDFADPDAAPVGSVS